MIISPQTEEKLKELFVKIFLSRTDEVTKVTDGSVMNATAYGVAKLGQKALKDIALAQSIFFPDAASGTQLDDIANFHGIAPRFGALGSSTYLRLVGDPGTSYIAGTQVFSGSNGVKFDLINSITIGNDGYTYARVQSQTTGDSTNVEALTITQVSPIPLGHKYVINEYKCFGGRDIEGDDIFRLRIKSYLDNFAQGTIGLITQVYMKLNPNVLRVINYGTNGNGKIILGVASQNGGDFTTTELDDLRLKGSSYLNLTDLNPDGLGNIGIELINIIWEPFDISFRVDLFGGFNPDEVRREIQIKTNKYLDYRFWVSGDTFQWDNVLQIVKDQQGVKYCPDQFFFPNNDLSTNYSKLPRIRGFQMLDLNGNIISNGSGTLNPVFYPAIADFSFQATVLANII